MKAESWRGDQVGGAVKASAWKTRQEKRRGGTTDPKWEINYLVLRGGRVSWGLVSRAGVPIFGGSWGPEWYNGRVSFLSLTPTLSPSLFSLPLFLACMGTQSELDVTDSRPAC